MSTRALVCDDDPQIQRALRVLLTSKGYEVEITATAEAAADAAALRTPEIALVDLVLPDHDGVWVCERIREWSRLPILVLSATGEEEAKVRALEAGADDYLTKPFGTAELLARMRAALRRATPAEEAAEVRVGDLVVDLPGHTVRRNGELVRLTPTEFRLLSVLVRYRGKLVTHSRLLTEAWGPEYADDVRVLRVHTANLRAKIEDDPSRPQLVLTDPGVGYRLAD